MQTKHLIITGKVQGVGYRANFQRKAQEIGQIAGWVRNLPDGSVEALIQGERHEIEALIAWARQGPRSAQVQNIEIEERGSDVKLPLPLQITT